MTQLTSTPDNASTGFLSRPWLATLTLDWEKALYATFIIVALVSRFWGLGDRVMSHDESLHTQYSYQFYIGDGYQHSPLMHGPSLFHATALSYWLFGANDFTSRIPDAILGIILVCLPYLLRGWLGRIGALFASFFLLISPFITYYSRYIRHDIYIAAAAFLVFTAAWYYLRQRQEKYLWWFSLGLVLMFITMETAYIYVAIFGSFVALRLANEIRLAPWLRQVAPQLRRPALVLLLAVLLFGVGFLGQRYIGSVMEQAGAATTTATSEGFAADPNEATQTATTTTQVTGGLAAMHWLQVAGIVVLAGGLFLAAQAMRPHLDGLPEFDLVVLFTTLVLPTATAFLIKTAGWNPRDYSMNICTPQGVENMSAFSAALVRLLNGECWRAYFTSGVVRSGIFLVFTLVVSVLVGLWWDRRRWLMAAAIYHSIFFVFFTSVFTNLPGWSSGMVGALGYWLEQQGVERGNQPGFYYFFIVPFYEFLPMLFAFLGVAFWARLKRIHKVAGYWLGLALLTLLAYSLVNWVANNPVRAAGGEMTDLPGLVGGGLVAAAGIVYWLMRLRHQWMAEYGLKRSWKGLLDSRDLFGFVPSLLWWLTLTYLIYSLAGEKMPWLTVHFVTPMALLAGWYFNEKLSGEAGRALFRQPVLRQLAITLLLLVAAFLALAPLLTGQISLGDQQLSNLTGLGRFLGSLVLIGVLVYFWRLNGRQVEAAGRRLVWPLALFILLSLLTIRFTYLSSFPNADYTTEFMVYAHGAPATKSAVMAQVDRLSMRLNGDKSMKVAFDDDSSWPMTWYLRDYPNRLFFGKNPGRNITDAPVIIAGSLNWSKVEPFLGDDYDTHTYTFLWWPMEEYRKISWNALLGDPNQPKESRRGLLNPNVRRAMWDIFFYRDYQKFGEVFGGTYTAGQWPLRHDLRLYIRKDVLANLWDYGVGAVNAEAPVDPYEANEFTPEAALTIGAAGAGQGQLQGPRNLAIGPDGNLYVADSGNHRIQVFDPSGGFVRAWGSQGDAAGQFNEPWGIAVDENYVYVADTWNHRLQKFTLRGDFVQTIGQGGSPAEGQEGGGLFFGPRSILLLPDDQLLVTDTGNHRLQILSRDGQFVRQVGLRGSEPGQFNEPVGLAVAPDGSIYLADTWNGRIQKFSAELQPLLQWQVDAWEGESTNNKPYLAVDNDGRVYVTDPEGYRVLIFSGDGEYLGRFGRYGQEQDALGLPTGIAVDGRDNVYVTDAANNRILQFAPIFGGS